KKFIVPANRLRPSLKHEDDFSADLTKEQIESFPPYSESHFESQEGWSDYEKRYRSHWETSPVMHRAESDRNVTPTTQQLERNPSSIRSSGALSEPSAGLSPTDKEPVNAANAPTGRVVPAGRDAVVISNSASG